MNVVDSSGGREFFGDGPNAEGVCAHHRERAGISRPSRSLDEVFKRVLLQRGEDAALQAVGVMAQGRVVDLSIPSR